MSDGHQNKLFLYCCLANESPLGPQGPNSLWSKSQIQLRLVLSIEIGSQWPPIADGFIKQSFIYASLPPFPLPTRRRSESRQCRRTWQLGALEIASTLTRSRRGYLSRNRSLGDKTRPLLSICSLEEVYHSHCILLEQPQEEDIAYSQ